MSNDTVIKRDGRIVKFDSEKIYAAIKAANDHFKNTSNALSDEEIRRITNDVTEQCKSHGKTFSVEEIQDMVERGIDSAGAFEVAKEYITYRYTHNLIRQKNTTDEKILSLIGLNSQEAKDENSNKNPVINSTQRDYMAGEVSRDLTERILLPKDIVEAHKKGIIHFHDSDYFAQHMHNCFSGNTKFITDTGIRTFNSFHDGDYTYVKDYHGNTRLAQVHKYGVQKLYKITFKNPRMEKVVHCTRNHRWMLKDGSITTNIQVGDVLAPAISSFDFSINGYDEARAFCAGFIIGDGCDRFVDNKEAGTQVRLCGNKTSYSNIFEQAGFKISKIKDSDDVTATIRIFSLKQNFLDGKAWRYLTPRYKELVFRGYYAADGAMHSNKISTTDIRIAEMIEEISGIAGYYISSTSEEIRDTNYKSDSILYSYHFITSTQNNWLWKVTSIEPYREADVWCVEEPVTHTFVLDDGMVTGNCDLVNLEDMLQNGTVITGTLIEKPHSFSTACNIATQIIAQVASNQYGGQSITLSHLAPFVDISRKKIRSIVVKEMEKAGIDASDEIIDSITEDRVRDEVKKGIQTIQYQVVTLLTTNGQAPFITVFMYLGEAKNDQEKHDLAMIIEETLLQRYQGVKNESGVWVTPAFPKLIYALDEDNIHEDSPYWYLTELAAKCTARRLVPDYISVKKMLELKGDVYTPMGCRSFLTPDRFTDAGTLGNVANAGNYVEGKHKYYGRFNQGVVTINLPYIALMSGGDKDKFWDIFEEYLEMCHRALRIRHERLLGTPSDVAPILWQYGALARLKKGEPIDKLLYGGYSTISLGYAGLYECVHYMTGNSHTEPNVGKPFAISVMQKMNDKCAEWKKAENIDYSLYGTPIESTTYKFANALKRDFGEIPGVSDHQYITNSYHIHVTEEINAFDKLKFESEFQALSPGGAISYIEVPDMKDNIPAVFEVMKFIYDNIIYAELNTKSDYCQVCGWDGEIPIKTDKESGRLIWECPNCGNRDQNKMNVARRTCGYIGTQFWNQGRTEEIRDRVLHL